MSATIDSTTSPHRQPPSQLAPSGIGLHTAQTERRQHVLGRRLDSHTISLIGLSELSGLDTKTRLRRAGGSVHHHVGLHLFGPCHDPALQVHRVGKPGLLHRGQGLG